MKNKIQNQQKKQALELEKVLKKNVFAYVNYNMNPFGMKTGDCVVRAVAYGLGETWESVIRQMTEMTVQTGKMMYYMDGENEFMKLKGWSRHPAPKHANGKIFTIRDFAQNIAVSGKKYIIRVRRHLTCLDGKVLVDIWDCSNRAICSYWTKDE